LLRVAFVVVVALETLLLVVEFDNDAVERVVDEAVPGAARS
jgi:diacylglycerol kinase